MASEPTAQRTPWGLLALLAVLFAAAHGQVPLYTSNQNTYFLHGLAWAGVGELGRDWLASTTTTVPMFSAYVAGVAGFLDPAVFYAVHAGLLAVYAGSLLALVSAVRPTTPDATLGLTAALLAPLHALVVTERLGPTAAHVVQHLTQGVAGQPLMRPFHQPSAFGVGLLVAVVLATRSRTLAAVALAGLVPWMHAVYLLPAGLFVVALAARERSEAPRVLGLFALLVAVPVVSALRFGDGSAEAARILVHERFPHHAELATWLDATAVAQGLWAGLGVALAWRERRVGVPLAVWAGAALVLTGLEAATASDRLAMLLPWRMLVLGVPTATALVAGTLADAVVSRLPESARSAVLGGSLVVLGGLAVAGAADTVTRIRAAAPGPLEAHARATCDADDVYLVRPEDGDFRLASACPVYVDWKSHPYRGHEVLAWYARVGRARAVFAARDASTAAAAVEAVRAEGVTHLVVPARREALYAPLGTVVARGGGRVVVAL
ncbi:MAG: hypothetical protein H6736_07305 [Alphaproteobacteria bacterium]|nr:hypothetical protein [Alphaproteobacteria bacterium]